MRIGPSLAATDEFGEPSALVDGLRHVARERVLEEAEHVEERALAAPVRPHDDSQPRQARQGHVAEEAVVADLDGLDLHGRGEVVLVRRTGLERFVLLRRTGYRSRAVCAEEGVSMRTVRARREISGHARTRPL